MTMQELRQLIYKGEKIDIECKKSESNIPSALYESYSGFANTKGGYIFLGVDEDKKKKQPEERFVIRGINNPSKLHSDFWNTINSNKVNINILKDEDVFIVEEDGINVLVIHVPRADYKERPVYIGENPFKGTFKRNHEGDYHATEREVIALLRDQNPEGNDSRILEYYTMEDIDEETLRHYRKMFQTCNPDHVWNSYEDKEFLRMLGGYKTNRRTEEEGLTVAGLMMFGKGLAIREEFSNISMDYRDESEVAPEVRWNDRITYDGTWENNLFNFFVKVSSKLTSDIAKPFKLEKQQRIDDTPIHKAVREAFVNLIIHADYFADAGVLKVIKYADGFLFVNPGTLKIPIEEIIKGGNSKPRNPSIQTMLRMVGFGDNAGSGFPAIMNAWKKSGWITPNLQEDTSLNQISLTLKMVPASQAMLKGMFANWAEKDLEAADLNKLTSLCNDEEINNRITQEDFAGAAELLLDKLLKVKDLRVDYSYWVGELDLVIETYSDNAGYRNNVAFYAEQLMETLLKSAESAEKSAESAEKSAEKSAESAEKLSNRHIQILDFMDEGVEYSAEDVATFLGLKPPRTRQLLNGLVDMGKVLTTASTKNRRYIKKGNMFFDVESI